METIIVNQLARIERVMAPKIEQIRKVILNQDVDRETLAELLGWLTAYGMVKDKSAEYVKFMLNVKPEDVSTDQWDKPLPGGVYTIEEWQPIREEFMALSKILTDRK